MATTNLNHIKRCLYLFTAMAIIAALYLSKPIAMPILVAGFIALFASPLVDVLCHLKIPKAVSSVFVVAIIMSVLGAVVIMASGPAIERLETAPLIGDRLMFELEAASENKLSKLTEANEGTSFRDSMNSGLLTLTTVLAEYTAVLLFQLTIVIILTYFFLAFGDDLMRSIVRAQSDFARKRITVRLFYDIRKDISHYLLVVSLINIGLGCATAATLSVIGFEDPLLWGALVTLFNYAPYIGPISVAIMLGSVGFAEGLSLSQALLPPGLFLALNLIESQFVTPTILGKKFNINPLLVVLWMFAWGWLWGAAGLLLAIPILVCFKIATTHLHFLGSWAELLKPGHLTETSGTSPGTSPSTSRDAATAPTNPAKALHGTLEAQD